MSDIRKGGLLEPRIGNPVPITAAATAYWGQDYLITGTSADYTVTLQTAVGHKGERMRLQCGNASALTKIITVDGNSSETVAGSTTRMIRAGESLILESDGTNVIRVGGVLIPFSVRITRTTNQTLTNGVYTACSLTTFVSGLSQMHDSGNGDVEIVRAGNYIAIGEGYANGLTTAAAFFGVFLNHNTTDIGNQTTVDGGGAQGYFSREFTCAAGDDVTFYFYGSNAPVLAAATLPAYLTVTERLSW